MLDLPPPLLVMTAVGIVAFAASGSLGFLLTTAFGGWVPFIVGGWYHAADPTRCRCTRMASTNIG